MNPCLTRKRRTSAGEAGIKTTSGVKTDSAAIVGRYGGVLGIIPNGPCG